MDDKIQRDSDVPLYSQLSNILKAHILAGKWGKDGQKLPPEVELSEQFKVARGTVRQALTELEAAGFIQRERGRGTFIRENALSSEGNQDNIGFVVPYVRDSFVMEILQGAENEAAESGISITFKQVDNTVNRQTAVLEELVKQNLKGIVLYPTTSTSKDSIAELIDKHYPIIMVDRYLYTLDADYVIGDNFGGGMQAMQHLLQLGHERIGFVTWQEQASSMDHRALAYQQALTEAGLPVLPALYCAVEGYPDIQLDTLSDFLQQASPPTAIFAANDQIALSIYKVAQNIGLTIPDDLALVGFGDIDIFSYLDVPLTTVALPTHNIGREAVKRLIDWSSFEHTARCILPAQLIVRASCGA